MNRQMQCTRSKVVLTVAILALCGLPQASRAMDQNSGATAISAGNAASQDAAARLNKKQFSAVKVSVKGEIATLTGSVDLYEYKADAERRVRKTKGVLAVRNLIQVAGPGIADQQLLDKLQEKLAWDRVGYGNLFNAITISVQNGVVTLGGRARSDIDKDSAISLVSTYPGVKDVVAEIEVDPTSVMDDQTRMAVARAIYGFSTLSRYASDPAKPIRISVQNGTVELYGTVDSEFDRNAAYLRANSVAGVFSVKNYLQVASQQAEGQR